MRLLILSPYPQSLCGPVRATDDEVLHSAGEMSEQDIVAASPDLIVSYGYRRILSKDIVRLFGGRMFNLHISLLPWNRGSDPNLWSFFDDTPKGVSIHEIDAGIDSGDVVAQEPVVFSGTETLASSYAMLRASIERLFAAIWPRLRSGQLVRSRQIGAGSYHRAIDKQPLMARLPLGWETPVSLVEALGARHRRGVGSTATPDLYSADGAAP